MSMSYELMMRKEEETMYATIKGSLTENDGVFSGFSTSNYLITQQYLKPQNDSWEIKLAVTTGNDITTDQGITSPLGIGINSVLFWCSGGKINIQLYDTTNNYFLGQVFNVQVNTKYYLKVTYRATEQRYIIAYSTDNTNYTVILNSVSDKIINQPDKYYNFGTARGQNRPFLGSIDLNNSYIKIGSTKYKLQAVVGYKKVGSPTITDGVVSGFSVSDYLYISNFPYTKNWSITIKASTTATGETQRCLYRSVNFQLRVNTINTWEIYASGVNKSLGQRPTSYPYVRVEKENGYISAYISQDGKTYSKVAENIDAGSVTDGSLSFSSDGDIWSGSIDLNETYIKVNGKLWFNGQQA